MQAETFQKFKSLIYKHSGIDLSAGKEALVSSRLAKRIRELGLSNEMEYYDYIDAEKSIDELTRLIDMMSTNVTSFMRESVHFDLIAKMLHELWADGPKPVKFWSAACSSGQEPYTLAMIAHEVAITKNVNPSLVKVLATDISTQILRKAEAGIYSARDLEALPTDWTRKYFQKTQTAGEYQVSDSIRSMVTFRRINLSETPYPMQGPFDTVLCRNVMIYFDNKVRTQIVSEAQRLLKSGGYFLIGHSENLSGLSNRFQIAQPTVYRKVAQ